MMLSGIGGNFQKVGPEGSIADPGSSWFQHDLPSNLTPFDLRQRFSGLFQRHHCVQVGFDAAACRHVEKLPMICLSLCRVVVTEAAPEDTDDAVTLDERKIERNLGDCPFSKSDHQPTTIPRC